MSASASRSNVNRRSALIKLALENGGHLSVDQLDCVADERKTLRRLVEEGVLVHCRRGLYVLSSPAGQDPTHRLRILAAHLNGVVSHQSAIRLFGFTALDGSRSRRATGQGVQEHLTIPYDRNPDRIKGLTLHRTQCLRTIDYRLHKGIRVTSPMRTLIDVAVPEAGVPFETLVDLVDHFVVNRLTSMAAAEDFLERSKGLHGIKLAKRVLAVTSGPPVESAAERQLLRLLENTNLPTPHSQYVLRDEDGRFIARLDCAWPAHRIALEVDGYRYHSTSRAFRADRERGNRIQAQGWSVFRTTTTEIGTGAPILIAALRAALTPQGERRQRRGAADGIN